MGTTDDLRPSAEPGAGRYQWVVATLVVAAAVLPIVTPAAMLLSLLLVGLAGVATAMDWRGRSTRRIFALGALLVIAVWALSVVPA